MGNVEGFLVIIVVELCGVLFLLSMIEGKMK
jgi:hypothetical protein